MSVRQGLRIGFMGAGGVGKTTTRDFLVEKLDLPTFESASRIIYTEEGLSEEIVQVEFSNEEKLDLQRKIFDKKVEQDQAFSYITDRTVLDHYAYCLAYCGGFMSNEIYEQFEEKVRTLMHSTYTHIFYFPWGYWEAGSDGVRQDRKSWQSQIDALIMGYTVRWGLPVIEVPQVRGEDFRNEWVLEHIVGKREE